MTETQRDELLLQMSKQMITMNENMTTMETRIHKEMENMKQEINQKISKEIGKVYIEMEKIQKEVVESQKEIGKINEEIVTINKELVRINVEIAKIWKETDKISQTVARIEVEHGNKLEALFDAFKLHDEKFINYENRIANCEKKLEKQDDKIYFLEQRTRYIIPKHRKRKPRKGKIPITRFSFILIDKYYY